MKKVLYILSLAAFSITIALSLIVALLQNSQVQMAIVKTTTSELSKKLNTSFTISDIQYHFPLKLSLHNIYIEDLQQDTLLYIKEIYLHLKPSYLKQKEIRFPNIAIRQGQLQIRNLQDGTPNYKFLLDMLPQNNTFEWNLPISFSADNIDLTNITITKEIDTINIEHLNVHLQQFFNNNINFSLNSLKGSLKNADEHIELQNAYFTLQTTDSSISIPRLSLKTQKSYALLSNFFVNKSPQTIATMNISKKTNNKESLADIPFQFDIKNTTICPKDFSLFSPILKNLSSTMNINMKCHGTINDLTIQPLDITIDNENAFKGNIQLQNIIYPNNASAELDLEKAKIKFSTLQDIIGNIQHQPFQFPKQVLLLNYAQLTGHASVNSKIIQFDGLIKTKPGELTTNIHILSEDTFQSAQVNATLSTNNFNLKQLQISPKLEKISAKININGSIIDKNTIIGAINLNIPSFQYNNYHYKNLHLNGELTKQYYKISINAEDENLNFTTTASINTQNPIPKILCDLTINNFTPHNLHLTKNLYNTQFSLNSLKIDMTASNLDDINGHVTLDTLTISSENKKVIMKKFEFSAFSDKNYKNFKLLSDFFTGKIEGIFSFDEIPATFQKFAVYYLSNLFTDKKIKQTLNHNMAGFVNFYLYGHDIAELQQVLKSPLSIGNNPTIKGFLNGTKNLWGIQCYIPSISIGNQKIEDITFSTDNRNNTGHFDLSAFWKNTTYLCNSSATDNKIDVSISSLTNDNLTSNVHLNTTIDRYNNSPIFNMHIFPSQFRFLDSTVSITESDIAYETSTKTLKIENFCVQTRGQAVKIDGICSPFENDSIKLSFNTVSVRPLMALAVPVEKFSVGGLLSGSVTAYSVFSTPMFEADVELDSAHLNESHIGTAFASASFNKENKTISLEGDVINNNKHTAYVTGLFEPLKKKWGININSDSVNIGFINHWTGDIITNIDGAVFGDVQVFGQGDQTWVMAKAKTLNAALTIPYTGCRYTLNDSVFMDSTSIRFPNTFMTDEEGNKLFIDGIMQHENFKNFRFAISAQTDHTLSINIPDKDGEFIQGKVYSSGTVSITGDLNQVILNAKVRSVGNSRFKMSVSGPSNAQNNNFITFVNENNIQLNTNTNTHNNSTPSAPSSENKETNSSNNTTFLLNLDIDVDPSLIFQLTINEKNNDMIEGRGNGTVKFSMQNNAEKMNMTGVYTLESGTFNFTIGNVIKRNFTIGTGSTVRWSGVPQSPELDIVAKYYVTTSLKDLFGDDISVLSKTRTSIPVNACIALQGTLDNPVLTYFIELPQADDVIKDHVKNIMSSGEMVTKQVLYLLIFGKFFTPDYLTSTDNFSLSDTYSLVSSTISGQINSWISKLTNVFSMGVNIRNESDGNTEYEAQIQLQPIDQLIINGNIGYRYNDVSNQQLFGDVDVEYKIIPDGRVRLKAYTHSLDKYSLRQATTQGVGFVFKHNFNWRKKKNK